MKAIVYHQYGSADVLRYTDVDKPTIGDDEVLVRLRASSINFADRVVAMRGEPKVARLAFGLRRPRKTIPGRDVAGTVEETGANVTRFRVGDEVFGEVNQLGFAEYVAAPEAGLAHKPAGVTFEQAATLPVAATAALKVVRVGGVQPGRSVLVHGASGGVGTFTVQLAKILGGQVTGACSDRNAELVRSLGADDIVDYRREDVTRGGRWFDVIIDLVGGHRLAAMRRVLAPKGVYVFSTGFGGPVLGSLPLLMTVVLQAPLAGGRLRIATVKKSPDDLTHLAGLVADGRLTPVIEATYPLSETAEAMRRLDAEHARGKVVLTV